MRAIPEACRPSMERAREIRGPNGCAYRDKGRRIVRWYSVEWTKARIEPARRETREIVRALRAARRSEGALIARWGVPT